MKPTKQHARKIIEILSHGLTSGLGQPEPGKFCVEAAVCFALGLPHGDEPPCVGQTVRRIKIALNDCQWSSNEARAKGMAKLAVAQLGSDEIDQLAFGTLLAFKTGTKIMPDILRELADTRFCKDKAALLALAQKMETAKAVDELSCAAIAARAALDALAAINAIAALAAIAARAALDALAALRDAFLNKMSGIILECLIELKSPGTKWLYLCKETTP